MAQAACRIAARLRVAATVTVTVTGWTAQYVARHRPPQPILAATPLAETYRRLSLVRGVTPLLLPGGEESRDAMMRSAEVEVGDPAGRARRRSSCPAPRPAGTY